MSKRKHAIDAYYQRATGLHARGQFAEAQRMYQEILAAAPAHADSHHMLGVLALQTNQPEAALARFDQAIALRPRVSMYHVNRASALHRLSRPAEAAIACETALRLDRSSAEALQMLGHIQSDQGHAIAALAAYTDAARRRPALPDIHNNLGVALRNVGRLDEAESALREALRHEPGEAGILANLSSVLKELGQVTEAEVHLRAALRARPDDPILLYNLGLILLLTGRFAEGWPYYEARAHTPAVRFPAFPQPRWTGEPLEGRALLVHAEQGLGDTIQFCRYLPALARQVARTGQVVFDAPPRLRRLLASLGDAPPLVSLDKEQPAFDVVCALVSLPSLVSASPQDMGAMVPYLAAEPARVATWQARLGAPGFKVGIAWQGNPTSQAELGRSIPLEQFSRLAQVPGIRLISLQKHDGLDQLGRLPAGARIELLGDDFDSGPDAFLDASAVMQSLDLIVTSDTSIAHLAGALGRPVWVALQHVPDWRWMLERPDSPWYPTMHLYRQRARGEWSEVFDRIAADLGRLAGSRPEAAP
jgi:Tfp pilus assembly protein PilF